MIYGLGLSNDADGLARQGVPVLDYHGADGSAAGRRVDVRVVGDGHLTPLGGAFHRPAVRPKHARRECRLLCERRESGERKAYFSNPPASASLEEVVASMHGR